MDTRIYIADTAPLLIEDFYNSVSAALPTWRLDKAARYRHADDRAASAGAFILLMHALNSCGISIDEPEFIYGRHNKPSLKGYEDIHFNLSHSGRRVMCIIGDSENGCDVQRIDKNGDRIAARFFHSKETEYLNSITDDNLRTITFYKIWCIKESYLKAIGTGLAGELKSFVVNPETMSLSFPESTDSIHYDCSVKIYNPDDEYMYAAAATNLPDNIEIIYI